MVKFTILLKRNSTLTQAEFVEHHTGVHAALFMSIPVVKETVRRYVQQHAMAVELPGMPPVKYDGITELWFDDVAALGAVLFGHRVSGAGTAGRGGFSRPARVRLRGVDGDRRVSGERARA